MARSSASEASHTPDSGTARLAATLRTERWLHFAKAYGWTVVSNDGSVRGACLLEGIECHSWEQLAHRLDTDGSQPASSQQLPFQLT